MRNFESRLSRWQHEELRASVRRRCWSGQERFPVSVFGSVELNLAAGEAGQAHPASSCPPQLPWGPVYSQSRILISLSSFLVCTWIVCFESSGLFALWTKAGKKTKVVVFTAIQCAAIFGEISTEMSANCLWDSNVHQWKYAGGDGQISIGKRYKFILMLNRWLSVLFH